MNYTLHKISEIFIITSDEKTQNNELYYVWGGIGKAIGIYTKKKSDETNNDWCKKVIAQQNQIGFSDNIPEEKLKEIGWFDVDKLANEQYDLDTQKIPAPTSFWYDSQEIQYWSFVKGFLKSQELLSDRRFTLEDMEKAISIGLSVGYSPVYKVEDSEKTIKKIIQSISQKSWDVELEMEQEMVCENVFNGNSVNKGWVNKGLKPKLTNGKVTITKII